MSVLGHHCNLRDNVSRAIGCVVSTVDCFQGANLEKKNWSIPTRAAVFPHETSVVCSVGPHHQHCSLKVLDLEVFLLMRAVLMLFRFLVSIPFCKKARFLAVTFSMIEIVCWNVSMTPTNSASDLLQSFTSSVGYVFSDVKSHLFSTVF